MEENITFFSPSVGVWDKMTAASRVDVRRKEGKKDCRWRIEASGVKRPSEKGRLGKR